MVFCRFALFCGVFVLAACPAVPDDTSDTRRDRAGDGEGEGEGENGSAAVGDVCTFNADCQTALRCGCLDGTCLCEAGARGTGLNGVDVCVDGNDCATALCVEGNDGFACSGPCIDATDCGPALPVCADIAFLGPVCIRDAGGAG
jgi:hypothetical protein